MSHLSCSVCFTVKWYACHLGIKSVSASLVLQAHLHIRSVVSFIAEHIMSSQGSSRDSKDVVVSENEEDVPTSQTSSTTFSPEVHAAAAAMNAQKKAEMYAKAKATKKASKILTMPESMSVSALTVSLDDAKKKRDEAKKEAKVESTKVKLARKRVERVKAKAKELSNKDLYEVFLMRMQADKDKKAAEEAKEAKKKRRRSDFRSVNGTTPFLVN